MRTQIDVRVDTGGNNTNVQNPKNTPNYIARTLSSITQK